MVRIKKMDRIDAKSHQLKTEGFPEKARATGFQIALSSVGYRSEGFHLHPMPDPDIFSFIPTITVNHPWINSYCLDFIRKKLGIRLGILNIRCNVLARCLHIDLIKGFWIRDAE